MDLIGVSRRVPRSELVSPKDFLQSWDADVLEMTQMKPASESQIFHNIAAKMSATAETVKELAEVCGKNTLYCGNEPKNKVAMLQLKEIPPEVDLECVKYQLEHRKQRQENDSLKIHVNRNMKYNSLDDYLAVIVSNAAPRKNIPQEYIVKQPDVVLTVEITKCLMQGTVSQMIREKETFLVLGSQKLSELKDKIQCSLDAVIPGDYSCMPDVDPEKLQQTGDIFKSGFFFIENVFYNDLRLADNKDYSEPIIKWSTEHKPNIVLTKADMAKTTFFDLTIRLGHHYLYLHQGNCEHSVLFTDMRLFNTSDCQDLRTYPLSYIRRTKHRIVCQGCCKLSAKFIVQDSPLIPTDPCYLCRLCFKTLLYTKRGQKGSNFRAQHFLDTLKPAAVSDT